MLCCIDLSVQCGYTCVVNSLKSLTIFELGASCITITMSTSLFVSVQSLSNLLPAAERSNSFDQETVNKLEKRLSQRPEKTDLVDRNILKGTSY